jgi:pimeloyl-ACP methyl ester carboxylesterase
MLAVQLEVIARLPATNLIRSPLVFVHGASHGAWCWDEHFLDFFAAGGFTSYAISLRGHGGSEGRERLRWASVLDYVDDVRQVVSRLSETPVLVGHSLGGLVVQKYLEHGSARAAVLLASSPVGGMLRSGFRLFVRHPFRFAKVHLTLNPGVLYSTPASVRQFLFSANAGDDVVARCAARLGDESFRAFLDLSYNLPRAARIRSQGVPMLVLGAADDAIIRPSDVQKTASAYQASWKIFDGVAHDMMLDSGWEQVAHYIRDWLEANTSRNSNQTS